MDENELHDAKMAAGGASMDMLDAIFDAETLEQIVGLQRDAKRLIGTFEDRGVEHRVAVCAMLGALFAVVVPESD